MVAKKVLEDMVLVLSLKAGDQRGLWKMMVVMMVAGGIPFLRWLGSLLKRGGGGKREEITSGKKVSISLSRWKIKGTE